MSKAPASVRRPCALQTALYDARDESDELVPGDTGSILKCKRMLSDAREKLRQKLEALPDLEKTTAAAHKRFKEATRTRKEGEKRQLALVVAEAEAHKDYLSMYSSLYAQDVHTASIVDAACKSLQGMRKRVKLVED